MLIESISSIQRKLVVGILTSPPAMHALGWVSLRTVFWFKFTLSAYRFMYTSQRTMHFFLKSRRLFAYSGENFTTKFHAEKRKFERCTSSFL